MYSEVIDNTVNLYAKEDANTCYEIFCIYKCSLE